MTDSCSEKIFDSLLGEMLTNQHPPDLTDQIRERMRAEFGRDLLQPRSPSSVELAAQSAHGDATRSKFTANWQAPLIAILAMAAGLFVAFAGWRLWPTFDSNSQKDQTSIATRGATTDPDNKRPSDAGQKSTAVASTPRTSAGTSLSQPTIASDSITPKTRTFEAIPLDKLPFNVDLSEPTIAANSVSMAIQPVSAMTDEQIVEWVNAQFDQLWSNQNVRPAFALGEEALQSRIARMLTGDEQAMANVAPHDLTNKVLRSASFAEHWADQAVSYWLRGTAAANKQDKDGAALRAAIAQQIVARKPWNEILAGLIGSAPDKPEAAFLTALAGGNNHRLAGRIGSAVLDEALACARCHDASENGRVVSNDQDEYWSLIAILNGLDVKTSSTPRSRTLVDRQAELFADGKSPNVYFERPDGLLQAARYRLPAGDSWRTLEDSHTPRESLARWIATTPISDEAAVNLAWRILFGRPLVAQHAAMDGVGLSERRQILTTLAGQFQAHDRDISALVRWIVASRPFQTQSLDIDRQTWLLASDEDITRWNVSAANFATFARDAAAQRQVASLDSAIVSVVRWSSSDDERRATLAQPAFSAKNPKSKSGQPSAGSVSDQPATTYLIRSTQPTPAQNELINRLVASRLTWPQQVEHIAGLVGESGNDARVLRAADTLLKSKNGDRKAALFELLQCALLYEEAI